MYIHKLLLVTTLTSFAVARHYHAEKLADSQNKYPLESRNKEEHTRDTRALTNHNKIVPLIDIKQAPYQAGLILDFGHILSTCGGTLISPTRVVTAAHCNFYFTIIAKTITVVLGSNYLFHGGHRIKTSDITIHPEFNSETLHNDVAIIRIPEVNLTARIKPVFLPPRGYNFNGQVAIASGYGLYSDNDHLTTKQRLNAVKLVVIPNSECAEAYGYDHVFAGTICTRGRGGVGTCDGDSGGPLVIYKKRKPILIGITSFGSEMCENGLPSAYTRVSGFMRFITYV